MPSFIVNATLPGQDTNGVLRGLHYTLRRYQPFVEVSLTPPSVTRLPADALRFPALIDTGHSRTFTIGHRHLEVWAGIDPMQLRSPGEIDVTTASGDIYTLPRFNACLWLHPNIPSIDPLRIWLLGGFICYSRKLGKAGPPIPTIGVQTLHDAKLSLDMNFQSLTFSLDTP